MMRLQLTNERGFVVGQGATWPDETVTIWMKGFGAHNFDGRRSALDWVDQQRLEKGHALKPMDAIDCVPSVEPHGQLRPSEWISAHAGRKRGRPNPSGGYTYDIKLGDILDYLDAQHDERLRSAKT